MAMATAPAARGRSRPYIEPIRTSLLDLGRYSMRRSPDFQDTPIFSASSVSPTCKLPPLRSQSNEGMFEDHYSDCDTPRAVRRTPRICLQPLSELDLPTPKSTVPARLSPLSAQTLEPPAFWREASAEESRNLPAYASQREQVPLPSELYGRRQSAPTGAQIARNVRGHVRQQSAGRRESRVPDIMVMPVDIRRLSNVVPMGEHTPPSPFPREGRLTIRVVLHSPGRKPMVLMRSFDVDELRATIPDAPPPLAQTSPALRRVSINTSLASSAMFPSSLSPTWPSPPMTGRRHSSGAIRASEPPPSSAAVERRASRQEVSLVPMRESLPCCLFGPQTNLCFIHMGILQTRMIN